MQADNQTIPELGNRRLVGQKTAREQIARTLRSGRLSHAYLFSGPPGVGKTAFALAFAEWINGIDNLTDLQGAAKSHKSSWFNHPDIHLFIPITSDLAKKDRKRARELRERLQLLAKDPYEIIDFRMRPALDDENTSKNLQAFYPLDYFNDDIRDTCRLKPNEGAKTVVILTRIETMRKEAANAFLKLLEEPPDNVVFLLTADSTDQLLATILSRCQQVRLQPLDEQTITNALIEQDGHDPDQARYLARVSDGNYALTRFLDPDLLRQTRKEVITFLREVYTENAPALMQRIGRWHSKLNTENQVALCNTLEIVLRDLMIYRETGHREWITNIDQIDVIHKFCEALGEARLQEMIVELGDVKNAIEQNVQFKLAFTALALRYSRLMRGLDPVIPADQPWQHLPSQSTRNKTGGVQ